MTCSAFAKINLTLEVFGVRPDGFHALRSVVQPITLADTLDFTPAEAFTTDTGYPDDLILKAARKLADATDPQFFTDKAFAVSVTKRIPAGGGLGGGSADAAATLLALNELWALHLPIARLCEIAASVGSDVPALVLGQSAHRAVLMEGRGEVVSLIADSANEARPLTDHLVLANPGVSSSTPAVYRQCVARTARAVGAVNDLEAPACALYPAISATLEALRAQGLRGVMMSGSGATCFGFASSAEEAEKVVVRLKEQGLLAWSTAPLK